MKRVTVGPYQKDFHCWSFIYFHGEAETLCQDYQESIKDEWWSAPDLVYSDIPVEEMDDGINRVLFADGTELFCYLWSSCPAWRDGKAQVIRRGLLGLWSDEKALNYASARYSEKTSNL